MDVRIVSIDRNRDGRYREEEGKFTYSLPFTIMQETYSVKLEGKHAVPIAEELAEWLGSRLGANSYVRVIQNRAGATLEFIDGNKKEIGEEKPSADDCKRE